MPSSPKSLDPSTLAKLNGLHLRAARVVEGYLAGLHRSPFHGFSIEFTQHREYAPGDDLRHLDWKVFARTDKLYLKQYEDETNLICHLVVDASESMSYRGSRSAMSKFEYAQCLAASVAWLVLRQQDAVGLITLGTGILDQLAASSHPAHLKHLVQTLESRLPTSENRIGSLLSEWSPTISRRGIVLIISDFFDELEDVMSGLHRLRLQRQDVIALQVWDRDELEFPFSVPTLFRGMERHANLATDTRSIRHAYRQEVDAFRRRLERGCREHSIDFRSICTDQPVDRVLSSFLSRRNPSQA